MSNPRFRIPGPAGRVSLFDTLFDAPARPRDPVHTSAWKHISRAAMLSSVAERVADASKIDQAVTSLCGPASLMFATAKHRPLEYERFAMELYETGKSRLGKLKIAPGRDCRAVDPAGKIAAVDWVTLAGIRDSENAIWDYDDLDDEFAGITVPGTLAGWFEDAGYHGVKEEANIYLTKGEGNFREAVKLRQDGYNVCFLINAHVIEAGGTEHHGTLKQIVSVPNHWVTLQPGPVTMTTADVKFSVFTWGIGAYPVPFNPLPALTMEVWLQHYYGYVACLP